MKVSLLKIYRKNLKCLFLCYNSPSSKRISFPLWKKKNLDLPGAFCSQKPRWWTQKWRRSSRTYSNKAKRKKTYRSTTHICPEIYRIWGCAQTFCRAALHFNHSKKNISLKLFLMPKFGSLFIIKLPIACTATGQQSCPQDWMPQVSKELPYLSSIPGRNDAHISWILNSHNSTGCQEELLPGPLEIDDVNTYKWQNDLE